MGVTTLNESTRSAIDGTESVRLATAGANWKTSIAAIAAYAVTSAGLVAIATSGSASDLSTGTVPSARMTGAYTGITGVGTLVSGSIPESLVTGLAAVATSGAYADLSGAPSIPAAANPSASVGLAAVNGVASTYMRSDAAPALDQTAAYAFSGLGATIAATLTLGGATLGDHVLAVTGTASISSSLSASSILSGPGGYSVWSTSPGVGTPKVAFDQISSGVVGVIYVSSDSIFGFNSATTLLSGGLDAAFSRIGPGNIGVGTGAAGSVSGTLSAAILILGSDAILHRAATATFQLGAINAASPVAQTLQAQGSRAGTDSNVGGANFTLQPGTGTGIGAVAALIVNSPILVASGSGAQTQQRTFAAINGNLVAGPGAALATNVVRGFLGMPYSAGAPTGTPDAITGGIPCQIDETNSKFMAYIGGAWKGVTLA